MNRGISQKRIWHPLLHFITCVGICCSNPFPFLEGQLCLYSFSQRVWRKCENPVIPLRGQSLPPSVGASASSDKRNVAGWFKIWSSSPEHWRTVWSVCLNCRIHSIASFPIAYFLFFSLAKNQQHNPKSSFQIFGCIHTVNSCFQSNGKTHFLVFGLEVNV